MELRFQGDVVTPWGIYFSGIANRMRIVYPESTKLQINFIPGEFPTVFAVSEGTADVGLTTPPAVAKMGLNGVGPFKRRLRNLRAIGSFPHYDQMCWAVPADSGISSIEDMPGNPMRIVLPSSDYPVRFLVEKILEYYGMSLDYLVRCGWKVVDDSQCLTIPRNVTEGRADAVVHEARMTPAWKELTDSRRMRFLPINEDALRRLESEYYFRRSVLPREILRGIDEDTPCVDFSDWLLFVREDMPFEMAHALTRIFVENKKELFEGTAMLGLSTPIDTKQVWKNVGVPLHPAAEKYYKDHGLMPREKESESEQLAKATV